MSVAGIVGSGPLLLAIPVAAAAGAVTFLSPCCLPLVPGYLSYLTGMTGADARQDSQAAAAPGDSGEGTDPGAVGGAVAARPRPAPAGLATPHRGRALAWPMLVGLGCS